MSDQKIRKENSVLAYIIVWIALAAGTLVTTAMGQNLPSEVPAAHPAVKPKVETRLLSPKVTPRNWVLGVRADASKTGYLIRFVQPISAAKRAGLEAGDRIVAVDGRLVGHVGNHLVPLGDTLERAGGNDGRIRLLVQNWRNKRLVSLRVTLMSPAESLGN